MRTESESSPANFDSIAACLAGQESRARALLEREVAYAGELTAMERLMHRLNAFVLGREVEQGNESLRRLSAWFDLPHPAGRHPRGECDFAALKLCRFWNMPATRALLTEETKGAVCRFFLEHDFSSMYQSENHALIFHTARYLMAQALPDQIFRAYNRTGAELAQLEERWLREFLLYRLACGWGEFDSSVYIGPVWESLSSLYDFTRDAEFKRLVDAVMNVILADMAVDSLCGMYGGAHGRIYPPQAIDHETEATRILQYLYFGQFEPPAGTGHVFVMDVATCAFRPCRAVIDVALNRSVAYENRERKHLHNVADVLPLKPLDGSVRKYTYWTPDYVLGAVQYQDDYPKESPRSCDCLEHPLMALHGKVDADQSCTVEYAHHQQHQWDLTFATGPRAKLFTHHPGTDGTHSHWTGDRLCGCGHFFQHRNVLVALYDIPQREPLAWIHAYVPRAEFDEVIERQGIVFVRAGNAAAALILLPSYRWTVEGEWAQREIVSDGRRHGVVCEATQLNSSAHFAAFQDEILGNAVTYDPTALRLEYRSRSAGVLAIDSAGGRFLNGAPVDLRYAKYDCPYLRSEWKSGQIEIVGPSGIRQEYSLS